MPSENNFKKRNPGWAKVWLSAGALPAITAQTLHEYMRIEKQVDIRMSISIDTLKTKLLQIVNLGPRRDRRKK
jgi:hypothetical protein